MPLSNQTCKKHHGLLGELFKICYLFTCDNLSIGEIMKITLSNQSIDQIKSPLLIINLFKDEVNQGKINQQLFVTLDKKYNGLIQSLVERKEITGDAGNIFYIPDKSQSLIIIGCGKTEDFTIEEWKLLGSQATKNAKSKGFSEYSIFPRGFENGHYRYSSLVEGIYVGDYNFTYYKEKKEEDKPETLINKIEIITNEDLSKIEPQIKEGEIISESIRFARDLINKPGNYCTPTILSNEAKRFAEGTPLKITVLDQPDIEKLNMGSFLSVARGSDEPPKFIIMHHNPEKKKSSEKVALVGKGVTFDTGGISLKPALDMHEMKGDMSGAAAVISAMVAISKINPAIEVLGLVPTTENMPSGKATKPGDIVRAMNGKNIEVLNTDAEGRLILADALCYAVRENATKIIDVATLTGACVVALGEITTGLMGNNQELANHFMNICNDSGEKVWQLPLFKKYHELIKSDVADIVNTGGRAGGAITAAAFLENFVDKKPWIHLDIAGTNWESKGNGYFSKGGTGCMVTSFVRYVMDLSSK